MFVPLSLPLQELFLLALDFLLLVALFFVFKLFPLEFVLDEAELTNECDLTSFVDLHGAICCVIFLCELVLLSELELKAVLSRLISSSLLITLLSCDLILHLKK